MSKQPPRAPRIRRPDLVGAALGFVMGMGDYVIVRSLGVQMRIGGQDVTFWVVLYFSVGFAVLGWLAGRLISSRRKLLAAEARLGEERTLAAIGRLAASVAHEVRNPLGVIRSSAAMIGDIVEGERDVQTATEFIVAEIDRLDALTTALLRYARPVRVHLEVVPLGDLVARARTLAAPALERHGVGLEGAPDELVDMPALADPDLTAQVLLNLLTNFAEAAEPGGRARFRSGREGAEVWLELADDGPGVDPAASELFEPFYTTKATGTGLGLATSRRLVESQGGRIEYRAGAGLGAGGAGACFRVTLPVLTQPPARPRAELGASA